MLAVLSFRKLNNYCISCFTDVMARLSTVKRNIEPSFPNIFKTLSSRASQDTSRGMPTISRHSRLEYWAFSQHCLSKVVHLVKNKLLAFFCYSQLCMRLWNWLITFTHLLHESPVYVAILQYFFKMKIQVAKLEN